MFKNTVSRFQFKYRKTREKYRSKIENYNINHFCRRFIQLSKFTYYMFRSLKLSILKNVCVNFELKCNLCQTIQPTQPTYGRSLLIWKKYYLAITLSHVSQTKIWKGYTLRKLEGNLVYRIRVTCPNQQQVEKRRVVWPVSSNSLPKDYHTST